MAYRLPFIEWRSPATVTPAQFDFADLVLLSGRVLPDSGCWIDRMAIILLVDNGFITSSGEWDAAKLGRVDPLQLLDRVYSQIELRLKITR